MDKKIDLNGIANEAGEAAKKLLKKTGDMTVKTMDQNDDGKFDKEDISLIAESIEELAKKGAKFMTSTAEEKSRQMDLKILKPVFKEDLDSADFMMPKFIRVCERDKRHAESEVCKGSIGYHSDIKDFKYINIFSDSAEEFGLDFYPDSTSEFYYMDPTDRDRYIALDEYFDYLKVVRVNELQKIAQDLGAKHFKVTYKEEKTSFSHNILQAGAKAVKNTVKAETNKSDNRFSSIAVEAEMDFPGHEPQKPILRYMQRDPSIQNLISLRMDSSAPLIRQRYMLKLSNTSGIKETDALKIDAVLKDMKISGNASVVSEAKNEARRYLEYEVEF